MTDDQDRIREQRNELARKAILAAQLSARKDLNGNLSPEAIAEAHKAAGMEPPARPTPPEPELTPEPEPRPGDGGARTDQPQPTAVDGLRQQITEAERAGDHDLAMHLKNERLIQLPKP